MNTPNLNFQNKKILSPDNLAALFQIDTVAYKQIE
jgi:hypothetical protein